MSIHVYKDIEKEINSNETSFSTRIKISLLSLFHSLKPASTFDINGTKYPYFYHPYNNTWRNERAVEIGYFKTLLEEVKPDLRILEIGNVLPHYCESSHTVLDKYERGERIINKDIVEYYPQDKFDLIISISTLEHVGYDEEPVEKDKAISALHHIKENILSPGGRAIISVPLNYNPYLDDFIYNQPAFFDKSIFMKRLDNKQGLLGKSPSLNNYWAICSKEDATSLTYNQKFPGANALFIGFINK